MDNPESCAYTLLSHGPAVPPIQVWLAEWMGTQVAAKELLGLADKAKDDAAKKRLDRGRETPEAQDDDGSDRCGTSGLVGLCAPIRPHFCGWGLILLYNSFTSPTCFVHLRATEAPLQPPMTALRVPAPCDAPPAARTAWMPRWPASSRL